MPTIGWEGRFRVAIGDREDLVGELTGEEERRGKRSRWEKIMPRWMMAGTREITPAGRFTVQQATDQEWTGALVVAEGMDPEQADHQLVQPLSGERRFPAGVRIIGGLRRGRRG